MNKITLQEINKCMELLSMSINDFNSDITELPEIYRNDGIDDTFNKFVKRFNELEKIIDKDLNNGTI